jgi:hypothetical protein
MQINEGFLHCKKSELPFPVVVEDDRTGNMVIQELYPGKRKPGSCIREASKEIVRRIRRLLK